VTRKSAWYSKYVHCTRRFYGWRSINVDGNFLSLHLDVFFFFSHKDANHFIWDIGKLSFECRAYKRQLMMKTAFSKVWKLYGAFSKNSKRDGRVITELGHSFSGEQKREVCRQPNFISSFSATFSNVCRLRWYTKTTAVHKQELDVYGVSITYMAYDMEERHCPCVTKKAIRATSV
jgi:hypothetical protein